MLRSTYVQKKVEEKKQKLVRESLHPIKRNDAVHLSVCCSAVFSLKQCVLLSHDDFGVAKKQCPLFTNFKTALRP